MTVYRRPDPIPLRRGSVTSGSAALASVRPEPDNLNRLVARKIFQAVDSGNFPAGSILPNEHQLAADLGVSRTALREAIKGLASKGLLETRRKRGTLVLGRERWNLLDAELISWSRREGGGRTSRDLWDAVSAAQAVIVAQVARTGHAVPLADVVQRFEAATGADQRRAVFCQMLFDVAALGNPYLRSLNASCLGNLLEEDPGFLDERIRNITAPALRELVDAVRARQPAVAYEASQQLFAGRDASAEALLEPAVG